VADADALRAAFPGVSGSEVVFLARQCLDAGAWDQALALCDALGSADDPGILLCEAVALFVSGSPEHALARVERVLQARPEHAAASSVRAEILARTGQRAEAAALLVQLLQRYPDYPGAQGLLGGLLLPGPHYREILARLHAVLSPRTYLEIGVESGATLALARGAEVAIGIDPGEQPLRHAVSAGTRVFREESDAFFAQHELERVLGTRRVDLAFIDGMHRFENALSDFANVERWAHAGATVVLHDCVPLIAGTASRERRSSFWVGDTWKTVLALAARRPKLRIRTVLTPPSGLVIVRRLDPNSSTLRDGFTEILAEFADREWSAAPGQVPAEFHPVSNDEAGLREALG
jgi:predicted O-methyltransferase YrrM